MVDAYELRLDWRVKPVGRDVVLGPEGRQRFKRSFHGCECCKAWRKKCDEKKPSCGLCSHRNTKCVYRNQRQSSEGLEAKLPRGTTMTTSLESAMKFQQICASFWGSSSPATYRGRLSWVASMMAMPQKSPALQMSLAAVALGRLGQKNKNCVMSLKSQNLYADALRCTQKALWTQKSWDTDTLLSIRLLHLYEAIECPRRSADASVLHCQGVSSYIIESLKHNSDLSLSDTGLSVVEDSFVYGAEMSSMNRCFHSPHIVEPIFKTWLTNTPSRLRRHCILAQLMSPMGWEARVLPFQVRNLPVDQQHSRIKDFVDRVIYYEAEVMKCRVDLLTSATSNGTAADELACYTIIFINGLSLMHCIQAVEFLDALEQVNGALAPSAAVPTAYATQQLSRLAQPEYWIQFADCSILYLDILSRLPGADSAAAVVLGQGLLWTLHCRQGLAYENEYVRKFEQVFGLGIVPVIEDYHCGTIRRYERDTIEATWEVFKQWSKNFIEPDTAAYEQETGQARLDSPAIKTEPIIPYVIREENT